MSRKMSSVNVALDIWARGLLLLCLEGLASRSFLDLRFFVCRSRGISSQHRASIYALITGLYT